MPKETLQEYKKRVAASGGRATVKKYGTGFFKKIGKRGLNKRYKKSHPLKKLFFE